ncbi:MAG: hypothetical protein HC906_13140 [Bacteroidales bacterium]|nr:hypothetical protein [Bacteroidales bacterium]
MEVKNQALLVNGIPVKLNGVNSHMQHPELGHAMDIETMRKDFILMKQFNINCVRTSHYPPNIEYLNLADEMGIYIVDETGDESHATEYISEKPEWKAAYIERVNKMVLRDRNHPSIIFWSAGNESGLAITFVKLYRRENDSIPPGFSCMEETPMMWAGNTKCPVKIFSVRGMLRPMNSKPAFVWYPNHKTRALLLWMNTYRLKVMPVEDWMNTGISFTNTPGALVGLYGTG